MTRDDKKVDKQSIFINYRRSDAAALAGRLQENISRVLPDSKVFLDVNAIQKGHNFESTILKNIDNAEVVLVLIGKGWMATGKDSSTPRICKEDDYVRLEISRALKQGKNIIPVLIDGAVMPDATTLPKDIRQLTFCNAAEIRHSRFNDDFNSLAHDICSFFSTKVAPKIRKNSTLKPYIGMATGAVLGVLALIITLSLIEQLTEHPPQNYLGKVGPILLIPVVTILGAYLGYRLVKNNPK